MKIKFFCPMWGSENLDFKSFLTKVKNAGYDGVEMGLPMEPERKEKVWELLNEFNLQIIAQHWETLTADYEAHKKEFRQRLENLAVSKPLFINSQTGKDFLLTNKMPSLFKLQRRFRINTVLKSFMKPIAENSVLQRI